MQIRSIVALAVASVVALVASIAIAQHPPVHYTRAQERVRCLEQCDRVHHACIDVMHHTPVECTRVDTPCRLSCNTRFPLPLGAPQNDIPVTGAP